MAIVKPFLCVHPSDGHYEEVSALPYDVFSREEAREEVKDKPYSFLNIDRPETQFSPEQDMYADCVYEKAARMLEAWEQKGILTEEKEACYYIYALTMDGREQNGIVACSSVDDYLTGVIRKHEFTLAEKEMDRIRHVDTCNAQTGPIFLAYRHQDKISSLIAEAKKEAPLFDFISEDGVRHAGWKIDDPAVNAALEKAFSTIPRTYIADGHHRCASAVKVALKRREEKPDYTGNEEFNYFLSILFPDDELCILPYNRVVHDLNGLTEEVFLEKVAEKFEISKSDTDVEPKEKGCCGMYLDKQWYLLKQKTEFVQDDSVEQLDVAFLQREIMEPVLGIADPKKDQRIGFSGGIRGNADLEKRCHTDMKVAFSMYPTSIQELFAVADAQRMMPPKSTWFEPKLRSGLFIHKF